MIVVMMMVMLAGMFAMEIAVANVMPMHPMVVLTVSRHPDEFIP